MSPAPAYDEFSMLADNAAEADLDFQPPVVRRINVDVSGGRSISGIQWGDASPDLVLLHGGAQNAHTWDTVALALNRPLVAFDLPGHGHTPWRDDHDYSLPNMAADIAAAIADVAPGAEAVIGMSLGGMTALTVAGVAPEVVRRLGLVDITPGVDEKKAEPIIAFVDGPQFFDDFDTLLARTIEFNPKRSESSLRRGVLHNAHEVEDGRWSWRWDPERPEKRSEDGSIGFDEMWDALGAVTVPVALWRGDRSTVVDDSDVELFRQHQPTGLYELVPDAGHSIQGDQPLVLARHIETFLSD